MKKFFLVMVLFILCSLSIFAYSESALKNIVLFTKVEFKKTNKKLENYNFSKVYEMNSGNYILFYNKKNEVKKGVFVSIFDESGLNDNLFFSEGAKKEYILDYYKDQGIELTNVYNSELN